MRRPLLILAGAALALYACGSRSHSQSDSVDSTSRQLPPPPTLFIMGRFGLRHSFRPGAGGSAVHSGCRSEGWRCLSCCNTQPCATQRCGRIAVQRRNARAAFRHDCLCAVCGQSAAAYHSRRRMGTQYAYRRNSAFSIQHRSRCHTQ